MIGHSDGAETLDQLARYEGRRKRCPARGEKHVVVESRSYNGGQSRSLSSGLNTLRSPPFPINQLTSTMIVVGILIVITLIKLAARKVSFVFEYWFFGLALVPLHL